MKRKLLTMLLTLSLVVSICPTAFAQESNAIATITDGSGEVIYTSVADLKKDMDDEAKYAYDGIKGTLTLLADIEYPLETGYGIMLGENGCLDLNGHTLTFSGLRAPISQEWGSPDFESSPINAYGVQYYYTDNPEGASCTIKNGTILMNCSILSGGEQGLYAFTSNFGGNITIENVSILTGESVTITSSILYKYGDGVTGTLRLKNCTIDAGSSSVIEAVAEDGATWPEDMKAVIISGSYKDLYSEGQLPANTKIQGSSSEMETKPDGVDEDTTVITSDATTAMIVANGNAYLYDDLETAMEAPVKDPGDSAVNTIQVMKPVEEPIKIPDGASFELTPYGENVNLTGGLKDQHGNIVKGGAITVTNGVPAVPAGGSVTTPEGYVVEGKADGDVPTIGSDGTVTVPVGGSITITPEGGQPVEIVGSETEPPKLEKDEDGKVVVTVPTGGKIGEEEVAAGGVTVGSDGSIAVASVTLDKTTLSLTVGGTAALKATVAPENATDKTVTWTSTDATVATVENGVVTASKVGTATITASAGGKEATCAVTVTAPSSSGSSRPSYSISVPSQVDNGTVTVSRKSATKGTTVTITVTPEEGYALASLTVTDGKGEELELTDKGDGKYTFNMPGSKVEIQAAFGKIFVPCQGGEDCPAHAFTDVDVEEWYHDEVDFVCEQGLMVGTAPDKFSPHMTTTRGMVATVLYRLEKASVTGAPVFADVPAGEWYSDAVLWASRNNIVSGYGNGTFGPHDPITREQLATMLYRYAGSPAVDGKLDGFTDAGQVSGYAADAMAWAVSTGIIGGMGDGILAPQGNATRAQVATMLMRFVANMTK